MTGDSQPTNRRPIPQMIGRRGRWLLAAVVIALVVYAATKVDWRAAGAALLHASLGLVVAAVVVNLLSVTLRGVRWWIFLRRAGDVSLGVAIRGAIVGSGFNNLLVADAGDLTRAVYVARLAGLSGSSVAATLALDRIFDPICFGLLLLLATFVIPLPEQLSGAQPIAATLLVVAILLLVLLLARARTAPPPSDSPTVIVGWRAALRSFRHHITALATARRFIMAL
ncbi:MAG TPA: lysylphosphatidylglycerol synthase transmembrane domain-containing protein, partial [Gemmatimonadaceae bacterium]